MTKLALDHILIERNPGEVRAAAIASDGRPWRLFWQRWEGLREPVRHGQIVEARVRTKDAAGNVFLEHIATTLWQGGHETLFMDKVHAQDLHEGQTLKCHVVCAARQDHAAKTVPCDPTLSVSKPEDAFEMWQQSLAMPSMSPLGTHPAPPEGLSSAFEEAEATTISIPSGGALHIERTRALTAIDVDSAGRVGKGSAGARALSLNRDAISETVRQLGLRGLGGAVVVDCVEPLNRNAKDQIRSKFIEIYQSVTTEPLEVIAPSKLGLLQAALPWHDTPWGESAETSETALLKALRDAQRELQADTSSFFTLMLGPSTYEAYLLRKDVVDRLVQDHFHGRIKLEKTGANQEGLKRQ
ncbi:ribonuclease E/G [Hyphomonas sp. FCG-A18]|uniref:ribonuclease E/G n=1 Tax=Hyphomonas sp. FCG-A18 TaxID=3080019 RepID=UPI002B2DBD37|nr:ribonuclease E/G [Hyphomonas sp. FCG-A18]